MVFKRVGPEHDHNPGLKNGKVLMFINKSLTTLQINNYKERWISFFSLKCITSLFTLYYINHNIKY